MLSAAFHALRSKKQENFQRFRLQLKQQKHKGGPSSSDGLNAAEVDAQDGSAEGPTQTEDHGAGIATAAEMLALKSKTELAEGRAAHAEACMLEAKARAAEAETRAAEADVRAASAGTRAHAMEARATRAEYTLSQMPWA